MDLVFMGTAPFAVPCLEALVREGHRVSAVVTQPDRPHGRGMKVVQSAVKATAVALGLPTLQPEKASNEEFIATLRELKPQCLVVVAYGQILRQAVLEIPPLGCINVHGSLLPELRGAAPIQWSIIRGHPETGVTTMFMDRGMDTGDMILKRALPILPEDTAGTLAERMAPLGADLLLETVRLLESGEVPRQPQDPAAATYAPMLTPADGLIDWQSSAIEIRNRIHGCNPSPGARAMLHGAPVKLWRAEVVPEVPAASPGTILEARDHFTVATAAGGVRLLELQPESRGRVDGPAFCRGQRLQVGHKWDLLS